MQRLIRRAILGGIAGIAASLALLPVLGHPVSYATISALVAARPAHRDARKAARAAIGYSGAGIVLPGAGAGSAAANIAGMSLPA